VLEELLRLREQLEVLAASPVVTGAHRLTADVAPVLEPVWTILAEHDALVDGVGFLRQLGMGSVSREASRTNSAVATQAVQRYSSLELTTPSMREVWKALARPAHTLLESVRGVAESDAGAECRLPRAGMIMPTVRPMLPGLLVSTRDTKVVPALRQVLRRWCDLARRGTDERREVARLTLAAALLARGAALGDDKEQTVEWFIKQWLGLRPTETRVDGVKAALLEDGWIRPNIDDDFSTVLDTVTDVRIQALYQHRLHRPVWETPLQGAPVALLSEPVGYRNTGGHRINIEVADVLANEEEPEFEEVVAQGFVVQQVAWALSTLSHREQMVLRHWMAGERAVDTRRILGITRYEYDRLKSKALSKLSRSQKLYIYLD